MDRLLCVSAIAMLGAIATAVAEREMDDAAAERYLVEARRWLIREGISGALSAGEKAMLATSLADWTAEELETATLRNEAVGVLLWAVASVEELPPTGTPFERLPADVPLLAATAAFRAAARLRPLEEIEAARAATELQAPSDRGPGAENPPTRRPTAAWPTRIAARSRRRSAQPRATPLRSGSTRSPG